MACRGVHFALTDAEVEHLRALPDEEERITYLVEEIEERYFDQFKDDLAESDKAWDAMHRALSDGQLTFDGGTYPLNHVVLGGELLTPETEDYIISLKTPDQVREIAAALAEITEDEFRRRYDAIDTETYPDQLNDLDLAYTWDWFQNVRRLFARAAAANRAVVFSVDL